MKFNFTGPVALIYVVAAIVLWNTVYLSRAVDSLRSQGMEIPEKYLQHLSSLG
jgi:TnpA family transposase